MKNRLHRRAIARLAGVWLIWLGLTGGLTATPSSSPAAGSEAQATPRVVSLAGAGWWLATDPRNRGREEQWFKEPRPDAKPTPVPWIIQGVFPDYHGVAWYWRDFLAPANTRPGGRTLLRFWAVDYQAEVWLNGQPVGQHEGGETPFVLDVTAVVHSGASNRLAVRVLNPTHVPVDGIVLNETAHRNKVVPYSAGSAWDLGGIMDEVELCLVPATRIEDVFVQPDPKTGTIRLEATLVNADSKVSQGHLEWSVAPAAGGALLAETSTSVDAAPGESRWSGTLRVAQPRLWELNDPFLYRVTARLTASEPAASDELAVRCGFRDFRFENGCFRLNGRRLFLRCSHTGNACPVGLELPLDPDWLRRDLLNVKVMGFNSIRFISGVAKRSQLDFCDELGLLVYEEPYAAWCMADSPRLAARYDESILGMVRRDRNHPSVALWGLLNETSDGPVFRHAVGLLPAVRALDPTRLVMLNSGRWDNQGSGLAGMETWREPGRPDPCVTHNGTQTVLKGLGITWAPGQLAFHPGREGQYAVVRWIAPSNASLQLSAAFASIAERATTDAHVLHNGRALFDGFINLHGSGPRAEFRTNLTVQTRDTLDCVLGFGNGDYGADTTALAFRLHSGDGATWDAAADFSRRANPNGAWSFGQLPPGSRPEASRLTLFTSGFEEKTIGTLSNPGSPAWEDVLSDQHPYQRVPHTADIIETLRTLQGGRNPVFVSEYGIGSAVDLWRAARHYERLGATNADDARFYRTQLDRFLADWERWRMDEAFGRPEDFFAASLRRMAGQRLLGLNALRANPHCVGHSLTGTVDQGMSGEGLFTTFREPKPGTVDALFDALAPLRWCLFVEPVQAYRGRPFRLEAVLANEDALAPGVYPVRLQVFGPANQLVWARQTNVTIAPAGVGPEPPFARPVLREEVRLDGPPGRYRWTATFERGAAATGGETEFYLADPAQLPPVEAEIVTWGEDEVLARWLREHQVRFRPMDAAPATVRQVILAGPRPPAPGGAPAFAELARRLARGSTAVFLCPEVFAQGGQRTALVPLARKGALSSLNSWLYHKDEWAKPHPIFTGLPTGLLDYTFYRELIPDTAWTGQDPPAEAVCGANDASLAYASGLMISVHRLGAGRFILNTLRLREHLGRHPAADRLLLNLLLHAARDAGQPLADPPSDWLPLLQPLGYR